MNHTPYRHSSFVIRISSFLLPLTLLGAGCQKLGIGIPSGSETGFVQNAWLPPPSPPEEPGIIALRELRAAIEAFQQVKSFRAKLSIDTDAGVTSGQIDVAKPDRFHGTIRVPQEKQDGEVVGVGNALYVKLPDGRWILVRSESLSKSLGDAFRSTVEGDRSLIQKHLPDDSIVTKKRDGGRSCDAYQTTIRDAEDRSVELLICVRDGLPKFMEATTPQGLVTVEYFDYNALFTIERPEASL